MIRFISVTRVRVVRVIMVRVIRVIGVIRIRVIRVTIRGTRIRVIRFKAFTTVQ